MAEPSTREKIKALVKAEPLLNMSQIAKRLAVSRERVRQIVREEALGVPRGVRGVRSRPPRCPPLPPQARLITGGVPIKLNATVVGTIGELLAAADLAARGFVVFFPLIRTASCDLITLDRQGKTERIEVRCGKRVNSDIRYSFKDHSRSDRHAVVVTGEPVIYKPPFDLVNALLLHQIQSI